jgi:hypothetical protein
MEPDAHQEVEAMTKPKNPKKAPKTTVAEYLAKEGHPEAAEVARKHAAESAHAEADAATEPETPDTTTPDLKVVEPNASDAPTAAKEDLVVFAMRVTQDERDLIHKAAGPGKASKFVRMVATAAARGDLDAVTRLIEARVK